MTGGVTHFTFEWEFGLVIASESFYQLYNMLSDSILHFQLGYKENFKLVHLFLFWYIDLIMSTVHPFATNAPIIAPIIAPKAVIWYNANQLTGLHMIDILVVKWLIIKLSQLLPITTSIKLKISCYNKIKMSATLFSSSFS